MFALVDAVSMYASCEKVFYPEIRRKPVIVLSNNDGCVVAVCPIAKRIGFKKFVPFFQIADCARKAGVVVRSSNYSLYADLSQRLMDTCARFAPSMHIYSIDEYFLRYDFDATDEYWWDLGNQIRRTVWKEVCLPVGVGFGTTPTLAKAANHAAKKLSGFKGVAVLNSHQSRQDVLPKMEVTDVWGIGKRLGNRLNLMNINTAMQLAKQPPQQMRKHFSITVENTVRELNGEVRLTWDEARADKKEIYSTRSFGQRITDKNQLKFALAKHAEIAAVKLRKQHCVAGAMIIFASSSPHDTAPYYRKSLLHSFAVPTSDTRNIIAATSAVLEKIYCAGVRYYKCGVGLMDIKSAVYSQGDLFSSSTDSPALMTCLDKINSRYGRSTLHFAAQGIEQKFDMRRDFLSKSSTTNWREIPRIKC